MRAKYLNMQVSAKLTKEKRKKLIAKILLTILGIFICFLIIFPIIWIIPAAFKDKKELFVLDDISWLPRNWSFKNFEKVFQIDVNGSSFIGAMFMTLLVALLSTVGSLLINMLAAYALARIEFKGKKWVWLFLLFPMFIPGITIMLTSIRVVNILNMVDTIFVLFVPGLANGYQIFFFRQFYLDIPGNIEEAGMMDGCSRIGMFFKIFLPMSTTPMVIIGVGTFMGAWNSFVWPTLTVTDNPALVQVMQIIQTINDSYSSDYGVVIAATLMSLIIPVAVLAIFEKKIVEGIALTGTK